MNLTHFRYPRSAFHASTTTPQEMPASPHDPESQRLWEAESEARTTFYHALTDLLVARGRTQRHQAHRDSLGSQERAVPVSDADLEALADDYVLRNVSLLTAIAECQFWDIVDDRMFRREATEEETAPALPRRRRREGSPHV